MSRLERSDDLTRAQALSSSGLALKSFSFLDQADVCKLAPLGRRDDAGTDDDKRQRSTQTSGCDAVDTGAIVTDLATCPVALVELQGKISAVPAGADRPSVKGRWPTRPLTGSLPVTSLDLARACEGRRCACIGRELFIRLAALAFRRRAKNPRLMQRVSNDECCSSSPVSAPRLSDTDSADRCTTLTEHFFTISCCSCSFFEL